MLALTVFAFPGGMVDWLDERNASGWLSGPLAFARGIDAASAAVGVKGAGQWLRGRFAAAIGDVDTLGRHSDAALGRRPFRRYQ